jgi:hypothetical protein
VPGVRRRIDVARARRGPRRGADVAREHSNLGADDRRRAGARRGDAAAADARFREALALDPADAVPCRRVRRLPDRHRTPRRRGAAARNPDTPRRAAVAPGHRREFLPERRERYDADRAELAARFDATRRRGDTVHRREEARYALEVENDPARALGLARANFAVQKEPADARLLADAARAAGAKP